MVSRWWVPGIGDGDETGAESHQDGDCGEMEKRFLSNLRCLGVGIGQRFLGSLRKHGIVVDLIPIFIIIKMKSQPYQVLLSRKLYVEVMKWKKNGVLCYCYWGFLFLYAIYRGLGYFVKHGKWGNDLEIMWFLGTGDNREEQGLNVVSLNTFDFFEEKLVLLQRRPFGEVSRESNMRVQLRKTGTFVMEICDAGFYSYRWPRWGMQPAS
ncbi:hypothetical protein F2Q68_00021936 [Brassica cretica]|uniref:Uncharacterized protein n=1 Tax=Brassica cretica TaxID=69181 RepID=A0A8S9FS01_BRACR|nr:hypothetical protein F2Q68_00021936 [Brassica cretica]